jgi:two-component system, NarL family, response regulator NreC
LPILTKRTYISPWCSLSWSERPCITYYAQSCKLLLQLEQFSQDHNVLREGLRGLLERQSGLEVVAEASDGRQAIRFAQQYLPKVAIVDIAMPGLNGIEAARAIIDTCSQTAVIILSMYHDESYVLRALKAGARAYLLKDSLKADLVAAVRGVVLGQSYFSPRVSQLLQEDYVREMAEKQKDDSYELLTVREREILQLAAEGNSNRDIANMLNLSLYTVDTHRSHILRKLNLHSVPELILYAVRKGIIR